MELDLTPFFQTKAQANDFSARLTTLSGAIYKTGFNLESELLSLYGIQKKDKFMSLLHDNKITTETPSALKEFITQLQEKISSLPVMALMVAIEPSEQTLKAIAEWFPLHLKHQVLFDITVKSELLAGATISYNGKYIDCSIRSIFSRVINESVDETKPNNNAENIENSQNTTLQDVNHMSIGR